VIKPLSVALIIFIAIALLVPPMSSGQTQSPLAIAEEAYSRGDYQKAQEQFAVAFRGGTSLEAGIGLADSLLKLDRWKEARDTALKAMRLRSTSPEATALYGDALFREGNLNDAGLQYLRALSLDQQNPRALIGLAVMKLSRAENEGAMAYLRDAIAAKPDTARAYYWMGVVLQNEGRYPEAADAYEKFLSYQATGYPETTLTEGLPQLLILLRTFGQSNPFSKTAPASVSMTIDWSRKIPVVTASINGIAAKLMIDTTIQNVLYIDAAIAAKAKIGNIVDLAGKNSSGRVSFLGKLDSLRLGDINAANIPVAVMDRESAEQKLGRKLTDVDGVIGINWLRSSVVAFDYKNSNLTIATSTFADSLHRLIAPSVIGTPPNVIIKLPFQIIRGRIIVTGSIGEDPVSVLLRTADVGMSVSSDYATEHFKPEQMTKSGQDDIVKNLILNFGGIDISNPNVELSKKLDDTISKETGLQFGGVLGQQFLRNLTKLTIDFANMTVTFEINRPAATSH